MNMWNIMFFNFLMFSLMYSNAFVNGKGMNTQCDVKQWYTELVDHINQHRIDLRGWQAAYLRKIRNLVEEYDDRKVTKPCSRLDRYYSYLLEDTDEEEPNLSDIDIKKQQIDVKINSIEREILSENSNDHNPYDVPHHSGKEEKGHNLQVDKPHENTNDSKEDANVSNIDRNFPFEDSSQNEEDVNDDIDPTDLSSLEEEDDDAENSKNSSSSEIDLDVSQQSDFQDLESHDEQMDFKSFDNEDLSVDDHIEEVENKSGADNNVGVEMNEKGDKSNVDHDSEGDNDNSKLANKIDVPEKKVEDKQVSDNLGLNHKKSDSENQSKQLKTSNNTNKNGWYEKSDVCINHYCFNLQRSRTKRQCVLSKNKDIDMNASFGVHGEANRNAKYINNEHTTNHKKVENEEENIRHSHDNRNQNKQYAEKENNSDKDIDAISDEKMNNLIDETRGEITENEGTHESTSEALDMNEVTTDSKTYNEEMSYSTHKDENTPDISLLLEHQELKTIQKIDKLELNFVKLENKFLTQSLEAKNDINSMQNLENHIMKLDNDLLKLNQSYNQLQRDHSAVKRKQKIQNANVQLYQNKIKTCTTTQPKSDNNFELITQQKSRIWELSQIVANQSLNIQQIQSRSSFLEEQNKHLFKMMMDQSALITNIISQIQEMSKNSAETKLETNELKLLMNHAFMSQRNKEQNTDAVNNIEDSSSNYNTDKPTEDTYQPREDMENSDSSSHLGDGNIEDTYQPREDLQASAFLPLETQESNNDKDITIEKFPTENKLQDLSKEKKRDNSESEGIIPKEQENLENDSDNDIPAVHNEETQLSVDQKNKDSILESSTIEKSNPQVPNHQENIESKIASTQDHPSDNQKPTNSADAQDKNNDTRTKADQPKARQIKRKLIHTILYSLHDPTKPADCYDLYQQKGVDSGMHKVFVPGMGLSVAVRCDKAGGSGGWTVLMRREDGREDFYNAFDKYRDGFGALRSDHYIGNEVIHFLTNQKHYSLRVDLTDWEGNTRYALYDQFWIDGEEDHFRLHLYGYSGTAGDGLAKHNGMKFSTFDVDNDLLKKELGGSCAKRFKGAGWYYKCYQSNLMGVYYKDGKIPEKQFDGITWKPWKGPNYSMKSVTLSIRPMGVE